MARSAGGGRDERHRGRGRARDGPSGLARSLRGGATASRAVGRGRRRRRRGGGGRAGRGSGRALAPRAGHLAGAPAAATACPTTSLRVAIVADRRSALLYRGLAALDEPTLAALAADPDAVRRLHSRHADVLAAFGARFRVREGAVVVPGGEEEEPAWGRLVGQSPRVPLAFLLVLLGANGGRQALLYDSVARLDPPRQRFALGLNRPAGPARVGALLSLAAVFDREVAWWHPEGGAFARPEADTARLLREVRVGSDGSLAPPSARVFWEAVFDEGKAALPADWAARVRASPPAEAAWLAERSGRASRRCAGGASISSSSPSGSSATRGRGRVAGRSGGGARAPEGTLRAARTRAHGLSRPGALRGGGGRRAPGGAGVGPGRAASGPRGVAGSARRHRPRPFRAHARPRGGRAPGAVAVRGAGGRRGARSGPRGLGRGGAPARARPRGLRRAAAGGAGDDDLASDGRRPGGRARATRAVSTGRACGTGPTPAARSSRGWSGSGRSNGAPAWRRPCACAAPRRRRRVTRAPPRSGRRSFPSSTRRTSGTPMARRSPARTPRGATSSAPSPGRCPRRSRAPGCPGTCGARSSASSGPSRASRSTASPATPCRKRLRSSTPWRAGASRYPRCSPTRAS